MIMFLYGCSASEELAVNEAEDPSREILLVDNIISKQVDVGRGDGTAYDISFNDEEDYCMLQFRMSTSDGMKYGCDADGDQDVDFYVQFTNPNRTEVVYLDVEGNILQRCRLTRSEGVGYNLDVIEIGKPYLETVLSRSSWESCFSRRMGSSIGVTMMVMSAFIGPEAGAGVAIGCALSCAIWAP